ncbi:hypothetical protein ABZW30_12005 [Kitasatospora sp. NPDC004669]|uniref:hypothetical protein n=1 Tax=Kitasatospora sp. NPDC004669 TaxID=3154555 RepID=UPI0033AAED2F
MLSFVIVVAVSSVLFVNGYGPLALADRSGRLGTGEAKGRIDHAVRATMDGISPSLTYTGAEFEVEREHDLWDGEPSMGSTVTEIVTVRTVISRAKLPTLMDQVAQAWKSLGSRGVDRSDPADEIQAMRGMGHVGGETFLTFYAKEQQDSTYLVTFRAEVYGALYQPAHEYKPLSPLARTPHDSKGYVITDPVDDPYWSH